MTDDKTRKYRQSKKSRAALSDDVTAALRPFINNGSVAGAVTLVADKDAILSLDTFGFADMANRKPMRPDTLFWIASQTKPITATAIMMLVDDGKVRIADPVAKYLSEFENIWLAAEQDDAHVLLRRPARPITVRDILSHTSGLPFKSAMETPTLDRLTLHDAAGSYAMTPLQSEPGAKYQYSNAGINIAGRIIEVVSGMSYAAFLKKRLLDPLGMNGTTFRPKGQQLSRLAKAYRPNTDGNALEQTRISQLSYPLDDRKRQPMPAGGLFSTADDVCRFCQMILNRGIFKGKRYLSEDAIAEMTRRQTDETLDASYGLGWSTADGVFGHGGALATNMTIDPSNGVIEIFLVQHAGFIGDGGNSRAAFHGAVSGLS